MKSKRIVFIGCVEAGYFTGKKLIEGGIRPSAIVSIDPEMAEKAQVSGYKNLFDLDKDAIHYHPEKYNLSGEKDYRFFAEHNFDVLIVMGWQRLIPDEIIKMLKICGLTIHGSAEGLPKGRGRSPMNWAIIEGHRQFRISLLTLSADADAGKVIDTVEFDILPTDDIRTLYCKNALASAMMMIKNIPLLTPESGITQNETEATYYPKRTAEDGHIQWSSGAAEVERLVRAVTHPYPGAFTYCNEEKIMIWKGQLFDHKLCTGKKPGTVAAVFPDASFLVSSGEKDFLVLDYEGKCPQEGDVLQ